MHTAQFLATAGFQKSHNHSTTAAIIVIAGIAIVAIGMLVAWLSRRG